MLKFKFVREGATTPSVGHVGDLGFDLYAADYVMLVPGDVTPVPTGLAVQLTLNNLAHTPMGFILKDRSSMAARGVTVSGGVIDSGYRGEIIVLMTYVVATPKDGLRFTIRKGDKIAQAVPVLPNTNHEFLLVHDFEETSRGTAGFGSTDIGRKTN